jgi:hypothetical protein
VRRAPTAIAATWSNVSVRNTFIWFNPPIGNVVFAANADPDLLAVGGKDSLVWRAAYMDHVLNGISRACHASETRRRR